MAKSIVATHRLRAEDFWVPLRFRGGKWHAAAMKEAGRQKFISHGRLGSPTLDLGHSPGEKPKPRIDLIIGRSGDPRDRVGFCYAVGIQTRNLP